MRKVHSNHANRISVKSTQKTLLFSLLKNKQQIHFGCEEEKKERKKEIEWGTFSAIYIIARDCINKENMND